jgi:hypothetical protein
MGLFVKSEKLTQSDKVQPKSVLKSSSSGMPPKNPRSQVIDTDNTATITMTNSHQGNRSTSKSDNLNNSLKNKIRAARKRGMKGDVQDLRFLIEEGPLSFRSFGFVGGFFMILAAALDFVEDNNSGDLNPMAKLITFYLWFCGVLAIQLEGRPFHMQIPVVYNVICEFFNFLKFVWGRGFFYFLTGCIQFFLFSKYNMICGVYFMILGVFSIVFGYRASVKLAALRNNISNKADIKFLFHSFDRDRDGYLNPEEFREMLFSLDQSLDYNDFVAAMSAVDSGNNQRVGYHDLEIWWDSYTKTDLPPGTSIYRTLSMQRFPSRPLTADSMV